MPKLLSISLLLETLENHNIDACIDKNYLMDKIYPLELRLSKEPNQTAQEEDF